MTTKTKTGPLVPMNAAAAVELAGALGGSLTPLGLDISDPNLPYENWENIGRVIGFMANAWQWCAGDWVNLGLRIYGDDAYQGASDDKDTRYDAVQRTLGREHQTVLNVASVCNRVARKVRRIELTFSHHAVVAPLESDEQKEWLRLAVENKWSVGELREAIREAKAGTPDAPTDGGSGGSGNLTHCEQIELAARVVFQNGQSTSDGHVLVPPEAWHSLSTALGEQ